MIEINEDIANNKEMTVLDKYRLVASMSIQFLETTNIYSALKNTKLGNIFFRVQIHEKIHLPIGNDYVPREFNLSIRSENELKEFTELIKKWNDVRIRNYKLQSHELDRLENENEKKVD